MLRSLLTTSGSWSSRALIIRLTSENYLPYGASDFAAMLLCSTEAIFARVSLAQQRSHRGYFKGAGLGLAACGETAPNVAVEDEPFERQVWMPAPALAPSLNTGADRAHVADWIPRPH